MIVFSNIKTFSSSDVSNANINIFKASNEEGRRGGSVLVVMFLSANTEGRFGLGGDVLKRQH